MTLSIDARPPEARHNSEPRFAIGQLLATPAALACLEQASVSLFDLVTRHITGDWGDLCPEDVQANEAALRYGNRLLSVYRVGDQTCYVITEATREATTVLLRSEY